MQSSLSIVLTGLFGQAFMPHGHCYLWAPSMVYAQVGSNLMIGLAYVSIATTLAILVRRIENIPFGWVYAAFGVFILSCGLTHFIDVITIWRPIYWADAAVRIVTALASVGTAIVLLPMLPRAEALAATARLSNDRKQKLESTLVELETAHRKLADREAEAQQRARASEEQFRSLVEAMPQLAWISGPDGSDLYRNSRWTEYSGVSLTELAERGWRAVIDPALLDDVEEHWRAALGSGRTFDTETRIGSQTGEYKWFIARAVPLRDRNQKIVRWVGTCTDIHDQRMLRDQAVQTGHMKDEFLATVSHELRTPLNAILGWARMLRAEAISPAMQTRALESIERNSVAQAQLIDDLLDISRIISGNMRLDLSVIDPLEAIQTAVDAVRPSAMAKKVQLLAALDVDKVSVLADPARMQQIVWNLLVNAVKFTPAGGRVQVRAISVDTHFEVTVADTGAGIRADFLSHVFDRFSQQDSSIRRKQGGLGLGLAIVRRLVELHGGTITAASPGEGQGATFRVSMPLASALPTAAELPVQAPRPRPVLPIEVPAELKGLRLLLVEDSEDSVELISAVLERCGVELAAAVDAEDALKLLATAPRFDVILSDIGLPGQDGYAFMSKVRANPRLATVPAAALTAFARSEDRRRALDVGYQMHVPKPVEPAELIAVVTNLAKIAAAARS